jgi:magnesium transporter
MKAELSIARQLVESHPVEASRMLEGLALEDMAAFLESGGRRAAASALQYIEPATGAQCLASWSDAFVADVLKLLTISHTARILRLMARGDREHVLSRVPPGEARVLRNLLKFPEGSAASLMQVEPLAFHRDLRVADAWKRLRRRRKRSGHYIYVVDLEGVLVGSVGFHQLLSADPRRTLHEIMSEPVESVPAFASAGAILDHPGWRRFPELPVVDESGGLVGWIRYSTFKNLELGRKAQPARRVWDSGLALGELYWAGSSQLLHGLLESILGSSLPSHTEEEAQ